MAQKRMFDKAIIDTDNFMDLPIGTKAVYFLLGMEADDEGFVSYKKVMRIHGGSEDDIKVLVAKNFLIQFPSGVVVITDWNKNNWLDTRRIKNTEYQHEKSLLVVNNDKTYSLSNGLATAKLEEYSIEENRVEEGEAKAPQISEIIKEFEAINPACKRMYGNKTQRKACQDLIDTYSFERVIAVIKGTLPKTNKMTANFFPNISTPLQLFDKWQKLEDAIVAYRSKKLLNNKVAF